MKENRRLAQELRKRGRELGCGKCRGAATGCLACRKIALDALGVSAEEVLQEKPEEE